MDLSFLALLTLILEIVHNTRMRNTISDLQSKIYQVPKIIQKPPIKTILHKYIYDTLNELNTTT